MCKIGKLGCQGSKLVLEAGGPCAETEMNEEQDMALTPAGGMLMNDPVSGRVTFI